MRVLLLSMPDSFEHMATVVIRMPNGALASLAGNVDPHHEMAIADLVLVQGRVGATVRRLVQDLIARAFGGSAQKLVLHALDAAKASPREMEQIRRLLDEREVPR